ncbi:NAD(P)/FAD-dependent oxidoreductase, partial [Chloroflexota bacterium]
GLEIISAEVLSVATKGDKKIISTNVGDFTAKTLIIAGGSDRVNLGVSGEKEFSGKGVSYCATCDGPLFTGKMVAVIGGGNTAVYEALHLSKFAAKVYLVHRRNSLRATAILQEKARSDPGIEFVLESVVKSIEGDNIVHKLILQNVKNQKQFVLEVDGVFIAIGLKPNTTYLGDMLQLDKQGNIITDGQMKTNIAGILAAGDIRAGSIRQVVAAAGDGAVAAIGAKNYIDV